MLIKMKYWPDTYLASIFEVPMKQHEANLASDLMNKKVKGEKNKTERIAQYGNFPS